MLLDLLENESALEVLAQAVALQRQGRPIINLGVGQPDAPTPAHICDAAIEAIRHGKHGYTPPLGIPELRASVSSYVKKHFGVEVEAERVVITPGGKMAICWALLICGGEGAEVLYPDPSFPIYASMARASGARGVPVPLKASNDFAMRASDLRPLLNERSRLLITNSPHNPTGSVMRAQHWQEIEELLQDFPRLTLLSDEIYSDFLFDDTEPHASALHCESLRERTILVHGWSKSFAMTGWRLGWSVWPRSFVSKVFSLAVNSYSCPATPLQDAGIAALEGSKEPVVRMRKSFAERARKITEAMNGIDGVVCVPPRGAFYVYPSLAGRGLTGSVVQKRWLDEIDVAVVAGIGFGQTGEHHIRLSCAASDEQIDEALRRIGAWFAKNPKK